MILLLIFLPLNFKEYFFNYFNLREKVADFYEQSSRRFSLAVGACRCLLKALKLYLKILISVHARITMWKNVMLVARKASCCVANVFSTGLKLIWPKSSLKSTKMSKKRIFCKKFQESMG